MGNLINKETDRRSTSTQAAICPRHRAVMVMEPAEPWSCCSNCGSMSLHLQLEQCCECGHRMQIQRPDPLWHCPVCRAKV